MARQLRAEQTRATIITATADLFDRQGYENTSLSDIVAHAHVTKGALYFHFAAKEDLAHAIMELQSRTSRRLAADLDTRGYSPLESLMRLTFGIARLSVEGPILRAGLRLANEGHEVRPPLTHPYTEWMELASTRLSRAMDTADLHPDVDVDAVSHALVASFVGTDVVGRTLDALDLRPRRVAEMWRLMIRSLVPVTRRARYVALAAGLEREVGRS
ncbi:ScbR family autoregulator-binding transcription factor [Streptomyces sp. ZYX-F-203]